MPTQTANPNYMPGSIGPGNTPTIPTQATPATPITPATSGAQPISVTGLQTPQTPIQIPSTPAVNTGAVTNASVPIPTIDSIVNKAVAPTAADNEQSSLLSQIATITGNTKSLATQQDESENAGGIPALNTTLTSLNTQLQGLTDQATKLQNDASVGGTIQNQGELDATGLRSEQGQAPLTTAALRTNQIQQAAIASQALTVKSAVYAAQGQYSIAKDAADKAAQVAFDASTQQINGLQAQLAALAPTLSKEQAAQAAALQAQLADRATQIQSQQSDFKTGQALAIAAMQNNPTDQAAQYAAQQALKIDPTDPQYLQKVTALVGNYQNDQVKAQLDQQLEKAQIGEANANTAKTLNDLNSASNGNANPISALPADQQAALKTTGFTNYNTETQGLAQQLATGNIAPSDLSKRATGSSPYNSILSAADAYAMATTGQHFNIAQAQRDYTFATNANTQNTLNYLKSLVGTNDGSGNLVGGNLQSLIAASNQRLPNTNPTNSFGGTAAGSFPAGSQGLPALNDTEQWLKLEAGNPQMAAYNATLTETSDQIAKILQGGGSGGTSDAKLAQAQALFQKGFTPNQVSAVATALQTLLTNRAKGIIGNNVYLSDYANDLNIPQKNAAAISAPATTYTANSITYVQGSDGLYYPQ